MPPIVFTDADSRQSVLNAAQEALDEAIDREEG
jgi:type III secretion system TyeA family effector delivery regulator